MTISRTAMVVALTAFAFTAPATAQIYGAAKKPKEEAAASATVTLPSGRQVKLSPKAGAAIVELQTAVRAKDAAAIAGKLEAAQKAARSNDEKYLVAALQTQAAVDSNNLPGVQAGIEALLASGGAENAEIAGQFGNLAMRYADAKQHDQAAAVLDRALSLNANDVRALKLLAITRNAQGRKPEAVQVMQRAIAAAKASGQVVAENEYKFALGIAHESKLPVTKDLARDWVSAYPTSANWHAALRIHRDVYNPQGAAFIDHMRLARAAGALTTGPEYYNFASELFDAGHHAEARAVIAEAASKGISVNSAEFKDLSGRLTTVKTRAQVDAQAKAATTAKAAIDAGDAYYGLGAYTEAAAQYRAALAKPGVDTNLANLRLGAALALAGEKAGATAALNAAGGAQADTAKYWLTWVGLRA